MTETVAGTSTSVTLADLRQLADSIEQARVAAELDILRRAKADYDAGRIGMSGIEDLYVELRHITTKGFHERWRTILGIPYAGIATRLAHRERKLARSVPNGVGGAYWTGTWPIGQADPLPLFGTPVAYVLFGADDRPIYIGSTDRLGIRLWNHSRDGKPFERWIAFRCNDRDHAYELEAELIDQHRLPLNRAAGRRPSATKTNKAI